MDQTKHRHSIVAIQDTFEEYPNRFLVYEDIAWQCRLFPNFPTQKTEEGNEAFIRQRLSHELKINPDQISIERKGEVIQEKFSVKHQENRFYDHIFYQVRISNFDKALQAPSFTIGGKTYYWMTCIEMENDPDIKEKNMGVVQEMERLIP